MIVLESKHVALTQ